MVPLVAKDEAAVAHLVIELALFLLLVLHLEQVGEVGSSLELHQEVRGIGALVGDRYVF